jgi:hypothetical protein
MASICSSGRSQTLGVEGKSGIIQIADTAITMVKAPSTKKSHLQAEKPSVPSRLPKIPDAIRAPNALLIELPQ